ncbi:MAG TPA: DUF1835 domain-containing protein [Calditrichia bacterium]|nr:DUF1835 domain-containing protein [Calditrichia bacterium]HQV32067.1 DUF1835 domain-containing protein [Calditrichia bacterium]
MSIPVSCHILNGDALQNQFPAELPGTQIVARECLVDGDVSGETLADFWANRARFICSCGEELTREDYHRKTVAEFQKIAAIPPEAEIYLWFEDDLFCLVNLWFVNFLLKHYQKPNSLFWVRPPAHNQYGFGGLTAKELITAFENRLPIRSPGKFARLWQHFQSGDSDGLLQAAKTLQGEFPFLMPAVRAYLESLPAGGNPGRPARVIGEILDELPEADFATVFREFSRRESIYGFGDLQVQRLFDAVRRNRKT